jgi:hypothetical protein
MTYVYYVDGEKFTTDKTHEIPLSKISSPDENTPAWENLSTGKKYWCNKGLFLHRLTGPAVINSDGQEHFWLNDNAYKNVHDWLKDHPNQDNAFQVEMLLKYT